MGKRPVLAALILLGSAALIAAASYFILYPHLLGRYHLRQAREAADAYQFSEARRHLDSCLMAWPGYGEAHFLMARTCRRSGDLTTARLHLQEAARQDWDSDDLDLEHQLLTAQSGHARLVDQALISYLGTGHRDEVYILEALVMSYLTSNFLDDAHHWCRFWIDHHPNMWRPLFLRGLILERGLKPQLALEQYQSLLAQHPEVAEARLQMGRILLRARQYAQAREQFAAYVASRPHDPEGVVALARCDRELRQPEAALAILDAMLAHHPDHAEGNLLKGKILLVDMGKSEAALPYLQKADALEPSHLETVGHLAQALRDVGRTAEARIYEEKSTILVEEFGKLDSLVRQIIATDQVKRQEADALAKNVQLRYEAGMALLRAGRREEGRAWLHSALQEDAHHEPSRQALEADFEKDRKSGGKSATPTAPARGQGDPVNTPR